MPVEANHPDQVACIGAHLFFKTNSLENFVFLAAMTSLIIEMFPVRSSGSFFTTNNATYTILILSVFICLIKKIDKRNSE